MPNLDISGLADDQRPTGAWAAALLHALARDEAAGRRPQRLTGPRLATWSRFRGRLTTADLLALVFEDAAVIHRVPFDPEALGDPIRLDRLPGALADGWLSALPSIGLKAPGADYAGEQARLLGQNDAFVPPHPQDIPAMALDLKLRALEGQAP